MSSLSFRRFTSAYALREVDPAVLIDFLRPHAAFLAGSGVTARVLDEDELAGAIESFDPLWEHLTNQERERMVQLLVRLVEYDAVTESISVTFHDGTFTDPEETDE